MVNEESKKPQQWSSAIGGIDSLVTSGKHSQVPFSLMFSSHVTYSQTYLDRVSGKKVFLCKNKFLPGWTMMEI
jgi:peptide methionine sulfoxide reductase MsrB